MAVKSAIISVSTTAVKLNTAVSICATATSTTVAVLETGI